MARFQVLPDRVDTIAVTIPDATMCQSNGAIWNCTVTVTGAGGSAKNRVEAFAGSCSWVVPAGVNNIFIEAWGAGGGGGGSGNCCCCSQGPGGGAGGYVAAQITTTPGCTYAMCGGTGGIYGCSACTNGGTGNTSYVTGYNLTNFCALGGGGGCSGPCNVPRTCFGYNQNNGAAGTIGTSTIVGNKIELLGEGGHSFGHPVGCRNENKGGSAPFNGGIGAWMGYQVCTPDWCNCASYGGDFPGGGGAGANQSCDCASCNCGGCGAAGLVRIWY